MNADGRLTYPPFAAVFLSISRLTSLQWGDDGARPEMVQEQCRLAVRPQENCVLTCIRDRGLHCEEGNHVLALNRSDPIAVIRWTSILLDANAYGSSPVHDMSEVFSLMHVGAGMALAVTLALEIQIEYGNHASNHASHWTGYIS